MRSLAESSFKTRYNGGVLINGSLDGSTPDLPQPSLSHRLRVSIFGDDVSACGLLPAQGSMRIGRGDDTDLRIKHPSVSRFHVELRVDASEGVISVLDPRKQK